MLDFNSPSGKKFSLFEVAREIVNFIQEDEKKIYKITIGTDSEVLEDNTADFVTAIVVHRKGNGGRYFWRRQVLGNFYNLHDRILKEVVLSLEVGIEILKQLKILLENNWQKENLPQWIFEIHVDVGENGETKTMIQEITGMIRAYNFEVITKPQSYAASNVADRHI
jgi:predicted RNase H-related nuclease YkuK (DUF458 family)